MTWVDRILATPCETDGATAGQTCGGRGTLVFCCSRIQAAEGAAPFSHDAVVAWIIDRTEQYSASSGYRAFVDELLEGIRTGEVEAAMGHGELDDILARMRK